jgi:hypothetical protein
MALSHQQSLTVFLYQVWNINYVLGTGPVSFLGQRATETPTLLGPINRPEVSITLPE